VSPRTDAGQTNRQTDRQTDRQTEEIDTQTDKHTIMATHPHELTPDIVIGK